MTNTLIGLIHTLLISIFGVLSAFHIFDMTDVQRGAVLTLYGAFAAVILALNAAYGKAHEIRQAARAHGVSVPKV
jgi:uncharacterized YccA/Bax inhibitor family protein